MKRFIVPFLVFALALTLMSASAMNIKAENGDSSVPEDALVTYGYLEVFKDELKKEILAELGAEGGLTASTPYSDISAKAGEIIYLSADSELIYRGGGAVVITSSNIAGEGIKDMSSGAELFSGQPLEYGHIYYPSETQSKKAVLVVGSNAYFTVRGSYEIG